MSKLAVVTGANRGVGLALVQQLKTKGYDVVGVCRKTSAELAQAGAEVIEGIDLGTDEGVAKAIGALKGRKIDLLVNNAGILIGDKVGDADKPAVTSEAMVKTFRLNTVAPILLVQGLLDSLPKGSKVVQITSRVASCADNTSGSAYSYRASKAALNIASVSLAVDLKPREIAVGIVHPGLVVTGMTAAFKVTKDTPNAVTTDQSASNIIQRIDALTMDNSGTFWHANGEVLPW